ncbi:MAG: histidine phosphatase family protein [Christensenellales bacterium]
MKLYVMRHGTTIWNEKGITQGRSNNRLSESGKALTREVAKQYKDYKFDIIYSSPLMRTMQTANIMNEYHKVKIVKDKRLIEIDQGIFTGRKKASLTDEEKKLKFAKDASCGMESYESVRDRSKDFLDFLKQNYDDKNVLIITHNANASIINCVIENIEINYHNRNLYNFKNAEIRCFDI